MSNHTTATYDQQPQDTQTPSTKHQKSQEPQQQAQKPLPLPAPSTAQEARKLDMSSGEATVKMDHLGPLVVNQDGSLSRISNWEQMTEFEKKNALRILGKRNQLRREALAGREGRGGAE